MKTLAFALAGAVSLLAVSAPASATELTIMSYNIWGGGANEQKPIDETVAVIRAVGADIIGVQETQTEGENCTAESCPPQGPSVAKALAQAAMKIGEAMYKQAGGGAAGADPAAGEAGPKSAEDDIVDADFTPTSEPTATDDHHDRIDFALAKAARLEVLAAGIVGEKAPYADLIVTPWPSDHRATYAKVKF